jgi:hypothetical protein
MFYHHKITKQKCIVQEKMIFSKKCFSNNFSNGISLLLLHFKKTIENEHKH